MDENPKLQVLDVREPHEVQIGTIPNTIKIPMDTVPACMEELDKSIEIIVHCKSGNRSAKVCDYLIQNNFSNIKNLRGGIIAWSQYVDPSIQII